MEKEKKFKEFEDKINNLQKNIEDIKSKLSEKETPDKFGLDDFIQECIGAFIIAFPVSMTEEIWEISEKLSFTRVLLILLVSLILVYFFIKHSKMHRWKEQNIGGVLPLRLITSFLIAFSISSLTLFILGVYPNILDNLEWFLKASILVTVFALVGSLGVDMIR